MEKTSEIKLSDSFGYSRLLRFTLPAVANMVFISVYGIVDGVFVANFAGSTAFAAINFILPFIMILSGGGNIIGTGGTALVAKIMGEGDQDRARGVFSLLILVMVVSGLIISVVGFILVRPVAVALGATGEMLEMCVDYGHICLLSTVFYMMQNASNSFLVAAERPKLSLRFNITAGVCNIILDIVLVGLLGFGVKGAAAATTISEVVGGSLPLIYFALPNKSLLRLCKPSRELWTVIKSFSNGLSEFVSSISMSVVNMVYNYELMLFLGEDGVAAYGVIMYVLWIFVAIYLGFAMGASPVISYKYGAQDYSQLKDLLKRCLVIMMTASVVLTIATEVLAPYMTLIFLSHEPAIAEMTVKGCRIFSLCLLFSGYNIFGSSFFTALNNGRVSATISFVRTFVFQLGSVLVLPMILGVNGIWGAIIVAEIGAAALTTYYIGANRQRYHYL